MQKIATAAASLLALLAIHNARADSESYPSGSAQPVFSSPARIDTGSETGATYMPGSAVAMTQGTALASSGSEGIMQTANSLPPGFAAGTPAYEYAQSIHRYPGARTGGLRQTQAARREGG